MANDINELETKIPERIGRLTELAYNLWWSWHLEARNLFSLLDHPLWRLSGHNPVKQLREVSPDRLKEAASDPDFLNLYDSVMATLDAETASNKTWFATNYPDLLSGPIAYFSMEFAIHNSLPIYAGGLGVLAGDICKEASDSGLPLVAVGFMYPQGYFHQRISAEGWQEEIYRLVNFHDVPISPCPSAEECGPLVQVQLEDRLVNVRVWLVRVGRVNLYLMDTNVNENLPHDRQLSDRLYTADREQRLQQEIVLGIGGVRVLRALGINPSVWHANEGHTAFMMLERVREEVEKGTPFSEATDKVKANTVFTTHTPVLSGHDVFYINLVERYFRSFWESLGIDRETFLNLGCEQEAEFNMTTLALKLSGQRNAVSKLHGKVARRMWHKFWPEAAEDNVPISHVTNGIHVPTWIAPELFELYAKYLGPDWMREQDDPSVWARVLEIPNEELWSIRQLLKRRLLTVMLERNRECLTRRQCALPQVLAMGAFLDSEWLTIGFCRRFAEYKRPTLIFHDIERLSRIVNNEWRPVQIVFAGKSHPADFASKYLLKEAYSAAMSKEFQGRIAFVEDYDIHLAHNLVQGVDVWLNTPRRLEEACGTSGIKASLNGVPHFSVRDGWWYEGYNGLNGWAIGNDNKVSDPWEEDRLDAESFYDILENEIVPLYYDRDHKGVPHDWIRVVKEAIRSVVPVFCSQRMLKEYASRLYLTTVQRESAV